MPSSWSKDELRDVLAHATPIVRTFLHGLAVHGSGTTRELGVQHMVAAIAQGYAKARGNYTIEAKYRENVARILAGLPKEPVASEVPKRRPGRPRKIEAEPTPAPPKRGPGRPRKIDIAVENLIGRTVSPRTNRKSDSITLPFAKIPDLEFWMKLVALANEAVRRGRPIRFISDGKDVTIEVVDRI
ncbi:MAG: hypothetical protein HY292_01215 [Planctomycetes bacterium]|nr:hypothetical protein [Planctomycetota bacterium]